jgi:uncharacterized protein (DUF2147 family)
MTQRKGHRPRPASIGTGPQCGGGRLRCTRRPIRACLLGALLLGLSAGAASAANGGPNILGDWARRDGGTRIRISPCGDALCAVNTWVRNPAGDEKPGDTLVMTLEPESPTELSGRAYDKRRDMTFSMNISLGPSGMRTDGCLFLGMLCRSAEWTRVP